MLMDRILNKVCSCKDCVFYDKCKANKVCEDFSPIDEDDYAENVEKYLKNHVEPSNETKLKRHPSNVGRYGISGSDESTDSRYVNFINDGLRIIRSGGVCYCYFIYQIEDILRFEPDVHINFHDGVYYITL